jgi:hypothetical protein
LHRSPARCRRRAWLLGEDNGDLVGDPLLDIDDGIVEQRLRRRRHGVEFHRRKGHAAIVCVAVCGRGSVSPTQPEAGPTIETSGATPSRAFVAALTSPRAFIGGRRSF